MFHCFFTSVICSPSLTKYHTQLLTLNLDSSGSAKWTLSRVGTAEERLEINREIKSLEEKLADVEHWEQRVKELDGLLGAGGIDSPGQHDVGGVEAEEGQKSR